MLNVTLDSLGLETVRGDESFVSRVQDMPVSKEEFFDFRESQWPDGKTTVSDKETGFPWMSWEYPQENYNGYMSVSLAQHPGAAMSKGDMSNYGRGYDFNKSENVTGNVNLGTNYEQQWETVFKNNADKKKQKVDTVMITGFNEWMAQKLDDGNTAFFVDTFSEEYSRDVEMMKGGYGDNYYLQLFKNIRAFKYSAPVKYKIDKKTPSLSAETGWDKVRSYPDFVGDALNRNYRNYLGNATLTDDTARNDIASVKVAHDSEKMYFRVETAADVTPYETGDKSWMNVWIGTKKDGIGYDYVINREYGKICRIENGNYAVAGDCDVYVSGKVMTIAVPLSAIGQTGDLPAIRFKVSDHVDSSDVMNFYIQGDSAPIGRLSYTYGYFD